MLKRLLGSLIGALLGSTLGFTAHQMMQGEESDDLTVGAPLSVLLVAFAIGLLSGRRGPVTAFVSGAVVGTALGTKLDRMAADYRNPSSTNSLQSSA